MRVVSLILVGVAQVRIDPPPRPTRAPLRCEPRLVLRVGGVVHVRPPTTFRVAGVIGELPTQIAGVDFLRVTESTMFAVRVRVR